MTAILPNRENPYSDRGPFEILGVERTVDARALRRAMQDKTDEVRSEHLDDESRIRKLDEINWAYEQLRNPRSRASLELFNFDPSSVQEDCQRRAGRLRSMDFDYERVFKGYEDILPSKPEVDVARLKTQALMLERSVALRPSSLRVVSDPQAEYRASMRFEN